MHIDGGQLATACETGLMKTLSVEVNYTTYWTQKDLSNNSWLQALHYYFTGLSRLLWTPSLEVVISIVKDDRSSKRIRLTQNGGCYRLTSETYRREESPRYELDVRVSSHTYI